MKLIYLLAIIGFLFTQCNTSAKKEFVSDITIPDAGPAKCSKHDLEAYNLSIASYSESKGVKYYLKNIPKNMDSAYTVSVVNRVLDILREHIEKPILELIPMSEVNKAILDGYNVIELRFEKMDGKGGTLGEAEYPPTDGTNKNKRSIVLDEYDMIGQEEGSAVYDFFTILLHESGHSVGLKHSDDIHAVMYWGYGGKKNGLSLDDIIGIRERYNKNSFSISHKRYKYFTKDMAGRFSQNFTYHEFYTKCNYNTGHYLDSALLPAIQAIRTHYKVPIKILSSYRTTECNHAAGGATMSRHLKNDAIDWKFTGRYASTIHARYIKDIQQKGVVFQHLFSLGIRGFGCYATSNHIDTREYSNMLYWKDAFYTAWGKANEKAYLAPDYFGIDNCE